MASKIFSTLVFCFAVAVLAGCDKDTPRRSPVGPTPIITPQEQARFSFDPVPPVAVSKNDTGYFRVNIEQGGVRTRLVAGVVSSNDHVLSLRLNGNRWRYTAVSGGAAEIRVMYAGKLRLSHGITVEDVRPVDSQFNDWFWRQLVFNQYDDPSRQRGNFTLDTTSPNVYIRMGDPTGRRVVSFQQRDHITRAVPRLAQQLTGSPYRGRIESGIEDRTRTGWITVRFVTQEEEPEISGGACGRARVGGDPGFIWIIRRARGNKRCVDPSYFPEIFSHEFGHAMGFFHVADRSVVMTSPRPIRRSTFNATEQYHARLAYEVGRVHQYCGWPFSRAYRHRLEGSKGVWLLYTPT